MPVATMGIGMSVGSALDGPDCSRHQFGCLATAFLGLNGLMLGTLGSTIVDMSVLAYDEKPHGTVGVAPLVDRDRSGLMLYGAF